MIYAVVFWWLAINWQGTVIWEGPLDDLWRCDRIRIGLEVYPNKWEVFNFRGNLVRLKDARIGACRPTSDVWTICDFPESKCAK